LSLARSYADLDLVLQDIPIPLFMQQGKPEADWTEDENKAFKEYERKCKELNEEREKFRKVSEKLAVSSTVDQ
jgi:hypothetical protein